MGSVLWPAWLQAIGGLGAFGVTAWLARLTLRYVRASEQIAAGGRQSQVAIARALLEDLKRIRSGLGPVPGETVPPPAEGLSIPRVHRWLELIIPQMALSNAGVVGGVMASAPRHTSLYKGNRLEWGSACP